MHGWKAEFGPDGFVRPVGRAADLFAAPGRAYVYRVYYTNWLLNVVTEPEGTAGAVLIRAVEPLAGEAAMAEHRPPTLRRRRDLTNGPGKLAQAFGVDGRHHGADLTRPPLYLAEDGAAPLPVAVSTRIGITRGIDRPYRFYVPGHPFVSPGEPSDLRVARKTRRQGQGACRSVSVQQRMPRSHGLLTAWPRRFVRSARPWTPPPTIRGSAGAVG